ncbi:MAG TPA: AAA family ATPase [Aestuariivirgaceae bacterium]|nr:AAA family ATPase [Aestuariivirgaceae bacterium]
MTQAMTIEESKPAEAVIAAVPRINIGIFCDHEATLQAMQQVAADRRMSRAHVTVQTGGIIGAFQAYSGALCPNLLIVESHSARDTILTELNQLAQVCDSSTKVIVIGHVNDVILYRELMRQGVSEYFVAPVNLLQMIQVISNLYSDPKAKPIGRVIAFVGAKGGVGSSTIAHNLGWMISRNYNTETVITDLDLAFGTAGLNFNQEGGMGIADALSSPERVDATLLDRLLTKCNDKLSLLACGGLVDRDFHIDSTAVGAVLDVVRHNVPLVIVDVPNVWAAWTKYTLIHADDVIITATPELAALRNAKNIFDVLKASRPNDSVPKVILNQVGVPKRPEIPAGEFAKALGVEPLAVIPYDSQVFGTASSNGQMIIEVASKSRVAEVMIELSQILSGREIPKPPAKFSIFAGKFPTLRKK